MEIGPYSASGSVDHSCDQPAHVASESSPEGGSRSQKKHCAALSNRPPRPLGFTNVENDCQAADVRYLGTHPIDTPATKK
jgi:hypothetical protein